MNPWVIQIRTEGVWHATDSYHPTKDAAHEAMLAMMNRDLEAETEAEAYRVYFDPRIKK